jgi:dihydroneopterin aldolase
MITIKIKNLRLKTIIGVYNWEQKIDRDININASFETDDKPTQSDELEDTIDYDKIVNSIKFIVENSKFKLVEGMLGAIIREITINPRIKKCFLEIEKIGAVKDLESFSVSTTWQRT